MNKRSLERNENSFKALLKYDPTLRGRRIDRIQSTDFEGFKVFRKAMDYSPAGINIDLRCFRTIFNYATKKGYLKSSPLIDVPMVIVQKTDVRFLNDDELIALNDTLGDLDLTDEFQKDARDLVLFYLYSGSRTSEALYPTFTWECDLQNSIRFPQTKWGKSRTIPKLDKVKLVLESRKHIEGGPFHLTRHQVYKRVKFVMKKAKIPDVSTHDLRKTAGAWYYMATHDIFAASKFLGHSNVLVTQDHYAGLIQSLQVEYARLFESALDSRLLISCYFETKLDQPRPTEVRSKDSLLSSTNPILTGRSAYGSRTRVTGLRGRRPDH